MNTVQEAKRFIGAGQFRNALDALCSEISYGLRDELLPTIASVDSETISARCGKGEGSADTVA